MLTKRLQRVFVWPSKNQKSGASDHKKKRNTPGALDLTTALPPLRMKNRLQSLKIHAQVTSANHQR